MRRRGRPGLVGTMARTAVIAGTANATVGAMNNRRSSKQQAAYDQQAAQDAAFQAQAELAELKAQQAAQEEMARLQEHQATKAELAALKAEQAAAAQPAAAPPAAADDDLMAQLQKLGELKAAGILDDAEFAAAKAKLLA